MSEKETSARLLRLKSSSLLVVLQQATRQFQTWKQKRSFRQVWKASFIATPASFSGEKHVRVGKLQDSKASETPHCRLGLNMSLQALNKLPILLGHHSRQPFRRLRSTDMIQPLPDVTAVHRVNDTATARPAVLDFKCVENSVEAIIHAHPEGLCICLHSWRGWAGWAWN